MQAQRTGQNAPTVTGPVGQKRPSAILKISEPASMIGKGRQTDGGDLEILGRTLHPEHLLQPYTISNLR